MRQGGGRRKTAHSFNTGRDIKRVEKKIVIANPAQFAQDRKLDDTDRAVRSVFYALDQDQNGELDLKEFQTALQQMDIVLPVPVVRFLFEAIDINNSGDISFDEFMGFINDESQTLEFQAEYVAEFHPEDKIGLELVLEEISDDEAGSTSSNGGKKRTRVKVANILDDDARSYVLPNSEVIKIDDVDVCGMTTDEIENLIHKKIKNSHLPCRITFKKTSNTEEKEKVAKMLGLIMGDEDWLVLSKHISKEKLAHRVKILKQPKLPDVRTKHCPDGDPETSWCVWLHLTFEDETFSRLSNFVVSFVTMLIFVSTLAYVLATIPQMREDPMWDWIETVVSACFTIEYAVKLFTSRNAWIFFFDPMSMIDFLAIIPWWVTICFGSAGTGSILRVIRVIRLARIIKLMRNPSFRQNFTIFSITFYKSSSSAGLLLTILSLSIIIFASLMYFAEQGNQDPVTGQIVRSDNEPTPFVSIPAGTWWCIVTMTTVGYGDMYPIETLGMVVATFAMFIGLFVIALPVIIIGGHFENTYEEHMAEKTRRKRREHLIATNEYENSVEKFLEDINDVINAACGVQDVRWDFFTPEDKTAFVEEQLQTRKKVEELLAVGRHAIHFLPKKVPEYKLFVLYEIFGKTCRTQDQDVDKFAKVKRHLMSKIQML